MRRLLLYQVALLLALIPVLRLLPAKVYEVLGPWPYVATGLYLLQAVGVPVAGQPPVPPHVPAVRDGAQPRADGLAAVCAGGRLREAAPAPRSVRLVRGIGWLAVVALGVSAVANVVGNVSLAEMLTAGLLDAGYVGLVLYAGVTVLASVLRLLLARRVFSQVPRRHAARRTAAEQRHPPAATGCGGDVGSRRAEPVPATPAASRRRRPPCSPTSSGFGQISITLGGVLLFLFSVWLAFWAARTVRVHPAGRGAAEDVAAAGRRQQHLIAHLLRAW